MKLTMEDRTCNDLARNYQYELFQICRKKNSIIALDTGSGKTFIALMLIKEFGKQIKGLTADGAKRTVFIVNTVPLVYQQAQYLKNHSFFKVGHFEGSLGVDFWTKEQWQEAVDESEILVMVAQVFCDALKHCHIKLEDINLMIADECHHVTGDHPMREIFRYYCNAKLRGSKNLPHVLGLTACIITGSGSLEKLPDMMKNLESNMDSTLVTSTFQDIVQKFSTHAEERIVEYSSVSPSASCFLLIHQILDRIEKKALGETGEISKFAKDLCRMIRNLKLTLSELGLYSFQRAITVESDLYSKSENCLPYVVPTLSNICVRLNQFLPTGDFEAQISPKVKRLLDVLRTCSPDSAILIFVEKRNTAKLLCEVLQRASEVCENLEFITAKWVVGGEHNSKDDIAVKQVEKQKETMRQFRNGEINTIVCTSVLEEGIDSECNYVVRFDEIKTYRSYVQSLGRARAHPSEFIVFAPSENLLDTHRTLQKYKLMKSQLIRNCHNRNSPERDDIQKVYEDQELESFEPYGSEGAKITPSGVLQLLNKYMGQLENDSFTKTVMAIDKICIDGGGYKVGLTLPINAHTSKTFWSTKRTSMHVAKREAGLLMAQELFRLGCFNEKLLPKRRITSDDDLDKYISISSVEKNPRHKPGTKQSADIFPRRICQAFHAKGKWYLNIITFKTTKESEVTHPVFSERNKMGILCSEKVLCSQFIVPNYAFGEIQIAVQPQEIDISPKVIQLAFKFHKTLMNRLLRLSANVFQEMSSVKNVIMVPVTSNDSIDISKLEEVSSTEHAFSNPPDFLKPGDMADAVVIPTHKETDTIYYVTKVCHEMSPLSPFVAHKKMYSSYLDYYKKVYDSAVSILNQPLIECRAFPLRQNYLSNLAMRETKKQNAVHFIPELCNFLQMNSGFWWKMKCLPSILYRINGLLLEQELLRSMNLIVPVSNGHRMNEDWSHLHTASLLAGGSGNLASQLVQKQKSTYYPGMILQSITPTYAGDNFDLERLEVLGDSFLKIHVSRFLFCNESCRDEGYLTAHRSKIVSNSTLSSLAKIKSLPDYCQNLSLNTPLFIIPYGFEVIPEVEDILLKNNIAPAEWSKFQKNIPIEEQDLNRAQKCSFNPYQDQAVSDKGTADMVEALIGTMLLTGGEAKAIDLMEWLGLTFVKTELKIPENACRDCVPSKGFIDEQFELNLLDSLEKIIGYKFRERTFLIEACTHASYQNYQHPTSSYQRLEFLGDAVLDYLITTYIYAKHPKTTPGQMTDLRTHYVNNDTLSEVSLKFGLHRFLLHHSSSLLQAITDLIEEKEQAKTADAGRARWKANSFHHKAVKVLGDQVEAIIGAIFCDTKFSFKEVWEAIRHMYADVFLENIDDIPKDPVRTLYEWSTKVQFIKLPETETNVKTYQVKVPGCPTITQSSENYKNAKKAVAESMLQYIKEHNIPKLQSPDNVI